MRKPTVARRRESAVSGPPRIEPLPAPAPGQALRFVTPEGRLTPQGEAFGVDMDLARLLFRDMVLARRFDAEALALARQGELGLWLMSLGQEAAQVGSIRALRGDDHVFPSYREHAAALSRGLGPAALLRQWRGLSHAGWDPSAHRFHFYSLVLGTQALHATGYGIGVTYDGSDEIVMTYFGDGASSQGDVNEALNWSATVRSPVLFFCQNNQWAISTPTVAQSRTALHQRAAGFGLDSYLVDGNDALAVHAVTSTAAARVREGRTPAFVEAETYRMAGHSTSDDPGRYRPDSEVDQWRLRDPISRLEAMLKEADVDASFFTEVEEQAIELAAETRRVCLSLPDPELADLFGTVYAEPHRLLDREAAAYAEYAASLESEVPA